jgi:hypothetical protein
LAVQEVRAAAFEHEQRSVVQGGLVKLACMLRGQLANHFEMTEFLDGDVLKHVPDVDIFDVKRLHPILQLSYFRCKDSGKYWIISEARGSIQLAASTWNHFPTKRNHLRVQLLDAITTQIEETSQ